MTARFPQQAPARFRRAAAFAIAVTLLPLPLAAAEPAPPATTQPLRASIAKHAAREALVSSPKRTERRASTQTRTQSSNQGGGKSFFRSPAGIACLAVIGAGTGYALYSTSNDRIHSVARDGQK